jgi:hypothetical protein
MYTCVSHHNAARLGEVMPIFGRLNNGRLGHCVSFYDLLEGRLVFKPLRTASRIRRRASD